MYRSKSGRPLSGYASKRVFRFVVLGQPFGAWHWRRNHNRGLVIRLGPVGHVQLQTFRCKFFGSGQKDGRRGRHGIDLHCWGVRGRRRKRGIGIHVTL